MRNIKIFVLPVVSIFFCIVGSNLVNYYNMNVFIPRTHSYIQPALCEMDSPAICTGSVVIDSI